MVGSKCRDFKNREVSNVNTPLVKFPHNKIKIDSVLLMMSLKLTIKVVAFFLGHPAYDARFSMFDKYFFIGTCSLPTHEKAT